MDELQDTQHFVTLGGADYPLRFELRDWRAAERALKLDLWPPCLTPAWKERGTFDTNALWLFIGLQSAKPEVTLEWIDEVQDFGSIPALDAAVKDFFRARGVDVEAIEKLRRQLLTGANSGPADASTSDSPKESSGG
jgi:hypothetical protein